MMSKNIKLSLGVIFCIFISTSSHAQKKNRHASEIYYAIGAEINPIPYISGGYSGSIWWGVAHFRIRGVAAYTTMPDFLIKDGFEQNKIRSYALSGDYFFDHAFKKLWTSCGFEYWQGSVINSDDHAAGKYSNYMLALEAGYVIKIWKNFYVNPSGLINMRLAGKNIVDVGNNSFNPNPLIPALSVKIGYHFRL